MFSLEVIIEDLSDDEDEFRDALENNEEPDCPQISLNALSH